MRRSAALFLFLLVPAASCSRPAGLFSEANARAHIGMLAGTIGSRPVGTPANARARAYIVDQLRLFGYDVRVQEADARRASVGRTARVANIIAMRPGRRTEAVGLVSHYDSVPEAPGAADDGLGVGVSLEAARVLAARADRNWTLMVLVTDGEEAGLMGAAALTTDREVTSRLQAYINLEAIGSAEPPTLFETGPGNGWLVATWARRSPHPRGASFGVEVYRRLPNDTDFSILKQQDIPGLNFAAIGDSYAYHTARDTPERLSPETVRTTGEQIVALIEAFDSVDITQRSPGERTYFDVNGIAALSYGQTIGTIIALGSLVLGAFAWFKVTVGAIRLGSVLRYVLTWIWALAGAAAVIASMVGTTWALRAAREVYHPWYARPGRLFLLILAVGVAVAWSFARLGPWLPPRMHGMRHPAVTWSLALPAWIVLAGASLWFAPAAAFLWVLPLLAAGLALSLVPASNDVAVRAASVVVLAVAATLWVPNTIALMRFMVAIFGRLPIVTPSVSYGAVMAVAGLMVVPPFIAAVAAPRPLLRPSLATAVCLLAVAITAGMAYVAPAYTFDQPLRRHVRAVQDSPDGPAVWEVASVEPGLDLGEGAPGGWAPASSPLQLGVPWRPLPHPFVFRTTTGPSLGPPPATVTGFAIEPVQAGSELTVTVVPREPGLAFSFILPAGVTPARASLPGVLRLGRWTAIYIAPPPEGILFRASVGSGTANRLGELRIVVAAQGFPGGQGWQRLPPWLPQEHAVWSADAVWVVNPAALPLAPVPPLR
jgi:Peptidase family M28